MWDLHSRSHPLKLLKSPVLGLVGAVPCLGLSWSEIVQGLQLPSEHSQMDTERAEGSGKRKQPPGQDPPLLGSRSREPAALRALWPSFLFSSLAGSSAVPAAISSIQQALPSVGLQRRPIRDQGAGSQVGLGLSGVGYAGGCDSRTFQTHVNPKHEL